MSAPRAIGVEVAVGFAGGAAGVQGRFDVDGQRWTVLGRQAYGRGPGDALDGIGHRSVSLVWRWVRTACGSGSPVISCQVRSTASSSSLMVRPGGTSPRPRPA